MKKLLIICLFLSVCTFAQDKFHLIQNRSTYSEIDSTEYYQDLANRYNRKYKKSIIPGVFLLVGGTAGIVGGVALWEDQKKLLSGYERQGIQKDLEYLGSICLLGAGTLSLAGGTALVVVGSLQKHKSNRYKQKLEDYQNKNTVSLSATPLFDPVNKSFGGSLALGF